MIGSEGFPPKTKAIRQYEDCYELCYEQFLDALYVKIDPDEDSSKSVTVEDFDACMDECSE